MDILKSILDPKELMRQLIILIKNFYYERLEFALKSFNRNLYLVLALLLLHYLQLASLLFTDSLLSVIAPANRPITQQITQTVIGILNISRIYPILQPFFDITTTKMYFNIVVLLVNVTFISILIMQFVFRDPITRIVLGQMSSFLFSVYNFIFLLPFIEIGMYESSYGQNSFDVIVGVINILLTLMIGIFVAIHDFDFSFTIVDFGSKSESSSNTIFVLLESIIAGVFVTNNVTLNQFIHLIACCYRIADLITNFPYYDRNVSKFNFSLSIAYFCLNLLLLIESLFSFSGSTEMSLIIIITLTIASKSSFMIYDFLITKLTEIPREKITNQDIISLYIRILYDFYNLRVTHYLEKDRGLFLETCVQEHKKYCKITREYGVDQCFCQFYDSKNIMNLSIEKQWKNFMTNYIVETFQNFFSLHEKDLTKCRRLQVTYASFLTEVVCQPSIAIRETLMLKNSSEDQPFKIKWAIQMLNRKVWQMYKPVINDKKIQNVRLSMSCMLNFDLQMEELCQLIKQQLIQMRQFTILLGGDYLNLNEIVNNSKKMQHLKKILKRRLIYLFDTNPHSTQLQNIAVIYSTNLDISGRSLKSFIRKSKQILTHNLITEGILLVHETKIEYLIYSYFYFYSILDYVIDVFQKKSCVIHITLLKETGKIIKVSQEITNVLGFVRQDLINKQLEEIIPQQFQKHHSVFIQNFINDGYKSEVTRDKLFTFAINKKSFIVPIELRAKIDYFSQQDYGVSGMITKVNQMMDFILLSDDFCISNMTEKLYRQCFAFQFKDDIYKIKNIDILRILPLIGAMNYKQSEELINGKSVNTLMMIPLSKQIMDQLNRRCGHPETELSLQLCKTFIHKYAFFEVSIDVKKMETMIGKSFYYIQFRQLRRIGRVSEKIDQFNDLKKDLNRLLNMELKMTQIDSDEAGKKNMNPFTKTYYYQSGKTFLSNTITNASIIDTKIFTFTTGQDNDDDDDDDEDEEEDNQDKNSQEGEEDNSYRIEQIEESQGEEDEDDEEDGNNDKAKTGYKTQCSILQNSQQMSQFAKQKQEDDLTASSIHRQENSSQNTHSLQNYLQEDEYKEQMTNKTGITENDVIVSTTQRNEYQGLLAKDNNNVSSYTLNQTNMNDLTTNRDGDYTKLDISDNQLINVKDTQRQSQSNITPRGQDRLFDNEESNYNDISFAPQDDQYQSDPNEEQSKRSEEDIQQKYMTRTMSTKQRNYAANKKKYSQSSAKSQFSSPNIKTRDELKQMYSLKSSRSNQSISSKKSTSTIKTKEIRKKKVSKLFKQVLRQVKNTILWFKKCKQQSYFRDENEREIAELKVDGVVIQDENNSILNENGKRMNNNQNFSISDLNENEDENFSPKKQLNSSKSLKKKKTMSKTQNQNQSFNDKKKKQQSGGASSSQQQTALQNYNIKKRIVKSIKNKKPTLSLYCNLFSF